MDIYVMRHGETDWNTALRLQGTTDIPLNENGIEMTEESSENIHAQGITFDRIYTSPLCRAVKTAQIVNKYSSAPIIKDSRITEFKFGEGEGRKVEDMQKDSRFKNIVYWFTDPSKYTADLGSESFEDFFGRLKDFVENELKPLENKCSSVLVTCHGGTTRGLLAVFENRGGDTLNKIKIPNCGVNKIVLKDGKFSVEYTARKFYASKESSSVHSFDNVK